MPRLLPQKKIMLIPLFGVICGALMAVRSAWSFWEIRAFKQEVAQLNVPAAWQLTASEDHRRSLGCIDISCPASSRTYSPGKNYKPLADAFKQIMTEGGYAITYHDERCGVKNLSNSRSAGEFYLCGTTGLKDGRRLTINALATADGYGSLSRLYVYLSLSPADDVRNRQPLPSKYPQVDMPVSD